MERTKILSIVSYLILPYHSGGQKSIAQFNEFLGEQCDLTVISTVNNDTSLAQNYTMLGWMHSGLSKFFQFSLIFRLKKLIETQKIQYIMLEHPYFGWLGWVLRLLCNTKLVIHTHNVEYMRFKSLGKIWWPILMWYERWILRSADAVFCISEDDRQFFIKHFGLETNKTTVITFGIPEGTIPADKKTSANRVRQLHQIAADTTIILFNGSLQYYPNAQAVQDIIEHINPRLLAIETLNYIIIICGKGLPAHFDDLTAYKDKHVLYTGLVPNIELYFKAADIFINPVLSGGGIKTKLVEALGYNTTVISTENGAIGCDKPASGPKLVTVKDHDWNGFSEAIINNIGKSVETPASFYDIYYWGSITKKALAHIQQL